MGFLRTTARLGTALMTMWCLLGCSAYEWMLSRGPCVGATMGVLASAQIDAGTAANAVVDAPPQTRAHFECARGDCFAIAAPPVAASMHLHVTVVSDNVDADALRSVPLQRTEPPPNSSLIA